MSLIPHTPAEFLQVCRRCDRLQNFWARWFAVPFPSLEERAADVDRLVATATTEGEEQFALDRARGDGLAWMPRAITDDVEEMVDRVMARGWR